PLANKKLEELGYECVIGNQTMMPLGEICFDFDRMQLVIPASYTPTPTYAPNFYRSPQRLFHLSLIEGCSGRKVDAIVDSGASGSILTNRYYKKNENRFTGRTATDSLRMAGVGGVNVVKTIPVSWTFTLAGKQYTETNIPVVTSSEQNEEYDCRIGLPTLMAHKKFIINFKNMWMRFED
ncbi:MAG: aspartyl protease family protein, partial [Muribaculaceae bacterium]|nr:aspartyl protease family protein [Muribaculaceae bacterium]